LNTEGETTNKMINIEIKREKEKKERGKKVIRRKEQLDRDRENRRK
jgi:hypothetical protein